MGNSISTIADDEIEIRKFSHFPANDMREWLDYFKLKYPSGYMRVNDFEEIFREYFPHSFGDDNHDQCYDDNHISISETNSYVSDFSKQLFNTINIGQTGAIDFNELLIAFSILTKGSSFEKIRWLFRFYDSDKDGVVSKEELLLSVRNLMHMVAEDSKIKGPGEIVDDIFKKLNNTSGFLEFNDFEALSTLHENEFRNISFFG